jgi:anti-sigma factor RsiW
MTCDKAAQVHAYYDGELPASQQQLMREHLLDCPECGRLLADLRRLSSLLAGASWPEVSAAAMQRLSRSWRVARDRGVRRVAEWLTGSAAAVLLAGLVLTPVTRPTDTATPGGRSITWEAVVTSPAQLDDADQETVQIAQWLANDLAAAESWRTQ